MNAFWEQDAPSAEAGLVLVCSEAPPCRPARSRTARAAAAWASPPRRRVAQPRADWRRPGLVARFNEPTTADLRALAALLVWAAGKSPPPGIVGTAQSAAAFLETHERLLPVQAVWLAWCSLVKLSQGDVLALARARDRLLERLFQNGLRPEQDLPSFLRFSGQPTSQRFRAVRQWLAHLADLAHAWAQEGRPSHIRHADERLRRSHLRLRPGPAGRKRRRPRDAQQGAKAFLGGENDVHQFLLGAYAYRINQALEGKPHAGPLPTEYFEHLELLDRMPRYVVDRLRQHARILEPNQKIDPYRHWASRMSDLDRELAELVDVNDRKEVISRVQRLLRDLPRGARSAEQRRASSRSALDLAPRISEDFAREFLDQVIPAYDALPEAREPMALLEQATFLEKSLPWPPTSTASNTSIRWSIGSSSCSGPRQATRPSSRWNRWPASVSAVCASWACATRSTCC